MDGRHSWGFTWPLLVFVVLLVSVLLLLAIPGMRRRSAMRAMRTCQQNLTKIDGAKAQWALDFQRHQGSPCQMSDIVRSEQEKVGYLRTAPTCPAGGTYRVNVLGEFPECTSSLPGHDLLGTEALPN